MSFNLISIVTEFYFENFFFRDTGKIEFISLKFYNKISVLLGR